jgi:plasmid rolling circle replication initiator protein Rep
MEVEYLSISTIPENLKVWQNLKTRSELLSTRLQKVAPKYAERMRDCCSKIKFLECPNGYMRFKDARFCRVRGCPMCEWRRSRYVAKVVCRASVATLEQYPKLHPILFHFPFLECDANQIKQSLNTLKMGWGKLSSLKLWKAKCKSHVCLTAINLVPDTQKISISMHCIAFMPSSFWTGASRTSQKMLSQTWQESLRVPTKLKATYKQFDSNYRVNQIGAKAKDLSTINLEQFPDDIIKTVCEQIHRAKLFSACSHFSQLYSAVEGERRYYPSERENIRRIRDKVYLYTPNPMDEDHENDFIDAAGLVIFPDDAEDFLAEYNVVSHQENPLLENYQDIVGA